MVPKSIQKFALVVLLMFWASFAFGQRAGVATFSAADVHEFDTVNLTTLVPTFNFPVVSKGVGALPGNIMIEAPQVCSEIPPGNLKEVSCINAAGEVVEEPMLTKMATIYTTVVNGSCNTYTITGLLGPDNLTVYSLPSTTLHYPSNCTGGNTATVTTNDGSGYTVGLSSVTGGPVVTSFTNTSGWTSSFGSTNTVDDAFSNSLSNNSTSFTDSLGAVTTYITGGFQYVDTGGNNQDVTSTTGSALAFSPYGCDNTNGPTTFTPITSINYPDSTKISIGWDKNGSNYSGLIGSITLRTGGTITYTYTTSGLCTPWYNTALTRATADGNTTYSISTASNSTTTTVKDPGLNKTVYVFVGSGNLGTVGPAPTFKSTIDRYQNTGTVGSPSYTHISETAYCYNTHISDCSTYIPAYPITQLDTYQYTYNGATQVTMSHDVKQYDSTYGLITSDAATDSITSQTITTTYVYGTYSSGSCSAITNTAIHDHLCTVTTKNGSTWLSESTYSYNSNGALTSSSACLTSTCTGSSALTTTYTPTSQGTYSAIQDPNGQTVNYTYGSCNSLMPTDVTTTVNSIAIDHKATWNCNAGVVTDTTDANSNEADYTYDSMNRPSTYHDYMGDTNTTSWAYGTPTLDHVKVTDNIGVVSYQYVDGLGRPTNHQVCQTSGCTNLDTSSTSYAWNGVNFETKTYVPCTKTTLNSACTTVAVTADVNPMGPSTTTDANSGTGTVAVNSKDWSFTAGPAPGIENTKVVQTEVDGFGRVTSTCAITASGYNGRVSCGQTMGGSGTLTSNTYSFPSAGVSEVQTTRGSQTHTTKTDALGRMTSITIPESGTTTYTYDATTGNPCGATDGNSTSAGDLVAIQDAAGNYICNYYDGLHRLFTVGNSNQSTSNSCKRFRFDSTANTPVTAPTGYPSSGANIIGRMFEASTDICTSSNNPITDEWYAYDAMGRLTDMWEKTPNSGSTYYHTTATYDADGMVTGLSGIPSYSSITWGLDGEERPNSMKYGTTTIISATAGNGFTYDAASRATNAPVGTGGDQDAFTYDNVGNMTEYTFNVGTKADDGKLTWNSIGSLNKLVINDTIASSTDSQTCTFGTSTVEGYDDVGRLLSDNCGTNWSQTYTYDQYDNLTQAGSYSWGCSTCYSSSTNQQTSTPILTYDSDGNVKADGSNTYTWNAYGKLASSISGNTAAVCGTSGECYVYDAFGNLVEQQFSSGNYQLLYSPIGRVANMSGQTPQWALIPAPGGGQFFHYNSTNYVVHTDWLGTARLVTDMSSNVYGGQAYAPYGQRYNTQGTAFTFFTGDIQDGSGLNLYLTDNRNLPESGIRWLSPDPAHSGWNAYAYVTDPNTQTDPSGLGVEGQQDESYLCPSCLSGNLQVICNNGGPVGPCSDVTDFHLLDSGVGFASGSGGPSINSNNTFSGGTAGNIFSGGFFSGGGTIENLFSGHYRGSNSIFGNGGMILTALGRTRWDKWWQETGCQAGKVCEGVVSNWEAPTFEVVQPGDNVLSAARGFVAEHPEYYNAKCGDCGKATGQFLKYAMDRGVYTRFQVINEKGWGPEFQQATNPMFNYTLIYGREGLIHAVNVTPDGWVIDMSGMQFRFDHPGEVSYPMIFPLDPHSF